MIAKTEKIKGIIFLLAVIVVLISCSSGEKDDDTPGDYEFSELESQVLTLINSHRATLSLAPLAETEVIRTEARKHSTNMADGSVAFGHDGFLDRINTIKQTITVTASAENVLMGVGEASAIVDSWLASSGHKANIEASYTKTGVGIAKSADNIYYCTQIFTKP